MIIAAATAGGKTEAAFLPILSAVASGSDRAAAPTGVRVLCVSPLRALINDQYDRIEQMAEWVGIGVHRWHGDVAASAKQRVLTERSGVLLITPESLEAIFVNRGSQAKGLFGGLRYVVVDELHSFLGSPRGAQLQSLLNRVELVIRRRPPRVGLSATLADIDQAAAFLRPTDPRAAAAVVDNLTGRGLLLQVRGYVESPNPRVSPEEPEPSESEDALLAADADRRRSEGVEGESDGDEGGRGAEQEIARRDAAEAEAERSVDAGGRCARQEIAEHIFGGLRGSDNLVFANRRRDVEDYADRLRLLSDRQRVVNEFWPHHGSLSRQIREDAEGALKDGSRPATALCTSTLEMGIDIGSLDSVAQIGPPPSVASMRQRLGRSGRRDQAAVLRIYLTEAQFNGGSHAVDELRCDVVQTVAMVRLMLARWLEAPDDPGFNYSTLVQQTMSAIAQHGGASAPDLHGALCGPGPFELVDAPRFERLLKAMIDKGLLAEEPNGLLLHGAKGERMVNHFSFYAAFETSAEWRLVAADKTLGTMPISYPLAAGDLLIFAGKRWSIVEADEPRRAILLAPSPGGRLPLFGGSGPLVSQRVRAEMVAVYESDDEPAWLDPKAAKLLDEGRVAWRRLGLGDTTVLRVGPGFLLFPWAGDRILRTMAVALRSAGVTGAVTYGPALEVRRSSAADLASAIRELLAHAPPAPATLAESIANRRIDKWDWVLDDALLNESAAARLLDLDGAWKALARISQDIDP